jgi:hypothetical protein
MMGNLIIVKHYGTQINWNQKMSKLKIMILEVWKVNMIMEIRKSLLIFWVIESKRKQTVLMDWMILKVILEIKI